MFDSKELCTPAYVYLVISVIALLIGMFITVEGRPMLCLGRPDCGIGTVVTLVFLEIIVLIFWTWMLDVLCKAGYKTISWFLVLFPFFLIFLFLFFVFYDIFFLKGNTYSIQQQHHAQPHNHKIRPQHYPNMTPFRR